MIITKIQYGLGNQLFQYAFAKRLSIESKAPLYLDLSWYENYNEENGYTKRDFLLDELNIAYNQANKSQIKKLKISPVSRKFLLKLRSLNHKLYLKLTNNFEAWAFEESNLDPVIMGRLYSKIYLISEWTNYQLIEPIRETLLNDFTLKKKPNNNNGIYLSNINSSNSVFIHIRRGDYLTKRMHDLGGICNEVYFDNAISYIQKKVSSPTFYVFSDDLEWCKEKFDHRGDFCFIEGNKTEPLEDLRLMMSCKHAIISNSTFSWWAAWLIKNMNKKIVTPSVWNKQNTKIIDKLIPENWHKLVVI